MADTEAQHLGPSLEKNNESDSKELNITSKGKGRKGKKSMRGKKKMGRGRKRGGRY